jgi:hypothetical protein
MKRSRVTILPLATALAALGGPAHAAIADAVREPIDEAKRNDAAQLKEQQPNAIFKSREELLGLLVSTAVDGTVVAQHWSHYSHSSHASHASHYSSGY